MDTTSSTKDIYYYWLQLWPSLVVALGIYAGGMTAGGVAKVLVPAAKDVVDGKTTEVATTLPMTFKLWWVTRWLHPMLVGGTVALVPGLPRPEWVDSTTGAVIWYGLVGLANGQVHIIAEGLGRQSTKLIGLIVPWVRQRLGLRASTPPATTSSATDPMPSSDGTELPKADDKP